MWDGGVKKNSAEAHTANCHRVSKENPATDCMSVMQNSRQSVAPVSFCVCMSACGRVRKKNNSRASRDGGLQLTVFMLCSNSCHHLEPGNALCFK